MKALTISQPYASLIATGEKFVENRTWSTNYRGPLAIHAGKGSQYLTRRQLADYPTGCVIAIANLRACLSLTSVRLMARGQLWISGERKEEIEQILDHKYTEGPWCWILKDVRSIEPVEAKGAQGLWEWQPPVPLVFCAQIAVDPESSRVEMAPGR